ncbi:MAG: glutamate synthase [Candidatus Poribacteria bacterium]|nr:MAG: glutamate synthase [Candidatus Poribacteria bacterium]
MNTGRSPRAVRTINSYLRVSPAHGRIRREFWTTERIAYLRQLSQTGKGVLTTLEEANRYAAGSRALRDRLSLVPLARKSALEGRAETRVVLGKGPKRIELSIPLVWGDMSFGAIHAQAVKALVRSAEVTGILSGTGEGGLHPEIRKYKRFNVQWASARFGVTLETLNMGMAIVIKIGQGAKPGIGGHLPGAKVVGDIPKTRRFPEGRDAISPAPHHDIYSIEDLGQRIWALKVATGQPVFVKVAATNYTPYVACGIARMGADGVVIDGQLAGTGATPEVVRDNVGIPIELAVAAADRMLREQTMDGQPLRDRVSIIAGGGVTSSTDILKLLALGADAAMMGTGPLVAMGCVMVHKCHTGKCPTALATQTPHRLLDDEWATERVINMVWGLKDELELLTAQLGADRIAELIGERRILRGRDLNEETLSILGVLPEDERSRIVLSIPEHAQEEDEEEPGIWAPWRREHIDALATSGEALITSMGSLAPPFVERPYVLCDWLRSDGAQVTRPSIDPYREEIETSVYLAQGAIRLSLPAFYDLSSFPDLPRPAVELFVRGAAALGTVCIVRADLVDEELLPYGRAILLDVLPREPISPDVVAVCAGLVTTATGREIGETIRMLQHAHQKPVFVRLPAGRTVERWAVRAARAGAEGIIIRDEPDPETGRFLWDLSSPELYPLEVAVSRADTALRLEREGRRPLRRKVNLLAESDRIRGAEDLFKISALGAEAVGVGTLGLLAAFGKTHEELISSLDELDWADPTPRRRLENHFWAMQKELKLLLGAAGTSSAGTIVSSRELVRSVDLDPELRRLLDVKPAGL